MNDPGDGRGHASILNPRARQVLNRDRGRVLIVDDDESVRKLLYDVLDDEYECHCATDGRDAIERSRTTDFDVVVTDVMMPGVSGLDLLAYLERQSPTTTFTR